jgi:hypothetical protein
VVELHELMLLTLAAAIAAPATAASAAVLHASLRQYAQPTSTTSPSMPNVGMSDNVIRIAA